MTARSTKALFRATKAKRLAPAGQGALLADLPEMRRGPDVRREVGLIFALANALESEARQKFYGRYGYGAP